MNTYTGTGYDKIEKRTTYVMQHPGLHKGKSVRVVADKPILVGDRINHNHEPGNWWLVTESVPGGASEFHGQTNYMVRFEGY